MIFKKYEQKLTVDGMHCQKCVARITEALRKTENVKKVSIDLDAKTVTVISKSEIKNDILKSAIEKLGFSVL